MATPISYFIPFEVCNLIETVLRFGSFAALWHWSLVAVIGMEIVVYMTLKVGRAMKPLASTDEDAARKPLRTVVAVGGAVVGSSLIVTIRAIRSDSDVDADLSLCFGSSCCKGETSNGS